MAKTMCKIAKDLPKNLAVYVEKVHSSTYICKKCGRTSNEEKLICKPIDL